MALVDNSGCFFLIDKKKKKKVVLSYMLCQMLRKIEINDDNRDSFV